MKNLLLTLTLILSGAYNFGYAAANSLALSESLRTGFKSVPVTETLARDIKNDNELNVALALNAYALICAIALFLVLANGRIKPFLKLLIVLMLAVSIGQALTEVDSIGTLPTPVVPGEAVTTAEQIDMMQLIGLQLALGFGQLIALHYGTKQEEVATPAPKQTVKR